MKKLLTKLLTTHYSLLTSSFTLIELLIYLAITSIMLSALILFAWNIIGLGAKSTTQQEVASQLRYLSEKLKYEIRNASDIDFPNSDFDVNLVSNPGTKLTLSGSPSKVIDVLGGIARISQGGPPIALNSTAVQLTDLTFTNYSSADNKTKHLGFTMTLELNSQSARQEYQQSETIRSSVEVRSN